MSVEAQSPQDLEFERKSLEAEKENATRSGVGTRQKVGKTRGKGTMVIVFEQFDDSKPDTLPTSMQQFMDVTGVKDEPTLVEYLISGHNDKLYTDASDPLAEYVNPAWPKDAQTQFRIVTRGYVKGLANSGMTIEKAVELIKPGFDAQYGK